jgi:ABC-type proline/glycine betaine transport system substrate-binding protein
MKGIRVVLVAALMALSLALGSGQASADGGKSVSPQGVTWESSAGLTWE